MSEAILKKLNQHDERFDVIESRLINHDKQFVEIKDELHGFRDAIMTALDEQLVIMQRLDQERIFTHEKIKRLKIKHLLKIT